MERSATCSSRREVTKNGVSVLTHFAELSRTVKADQVQLQRVILNLVINAVEAMSGMREEPRELPICTEKEESTARWWRCEIRVRDWIRRVWTAYSRPFIPPFAHPTSRSSIAQLSIDRQLIGFTIGTGRP